MKTRKKQRFSILGLSLSIPLEGYFHDEGYQKSMWNFYQRLNKLKKEETWPVEREELVRPDFSRVHGYSLGINFRDEEKGFPHFKRHVFIGYHRSEDPKENLMIQAHEEPHAADFLDARSELIRRIDYRFPLTPLILENVGSLSFEGVANIGMVFALRKKGFSYGEIRDLYLKLTKRDLAPLLNEAFEEAKDARL